MGTKHKGFEMNEAEVERRKGSRVVYVPAEDQSLHLVR